MRMSNNEIAENSFSIKRRRLITDSSSSEDDDDPTDASPKKSRICIQETDSECDSDNSTKICTRNNVARINSDSSSSSDSEVIRKVKRHPVLESENGDESSEWESANNESDAEEQTALQKTNGNAADGFSSDSSDGESEKCPICLMSFKNQEVGSPEACDHSFCVDCIQEWSKSVNTCPVDRKKFDLILVRTNYNGTYIRSITVQEPSENALETNYDASFCEVCGLSNHEDRLLLCDQCDAAYHLECLQPPLDEVPLEEWFCPVCSLNRLNLQLLDNFLHELDNVGLNWNETQRLVPRTRQTERIRNRIINQRATNENNNREDAGQYLEEMNRPGPSTSSRRTTTRKKATTRKRKYVKRKSTKKCKKSKQKSRYRTIYEIDDATGEKIALKKIIRKYKKKKKKLKKRKVRRIVIPKSVKNRLARQLGICPPTRIGQTLPDVKVQINTANIGQRRNQAGIPALHLFGQRDELDYFSASESEIEGPGVNILVARRPNISDTAVLQRASRNKTINLPTSTSASSVDLLGSILDTQTKFHSRKSIISVKSDGSIKIDIDNNPLLPSNQNVHVRQTPMSPNTNTTTKTSSSNGRGTSTVDTSNSNRYSEPINYSLYENTVPTSTVGSSNNGQHNYENNGPQDYSMNRIHCNTNEPDDSKEKKKNSRTGNLEENSTINSDSELDIYSDIETVSTSKVEDSEIQYHSPAPGTSTENITSIEDDNESDTDLVIDTEKPSDDKYDPAAAFESDNDEDTKDECVTSTSGTLVDIQPSNFTPTKWNAEIQSETVQSSNQTEFQQQFNTLQKTTEDNEDAEDDCPNFSIYSSESLHMAKHADILMEVNKIESNVTSENIGNTQTSTTQKTDKSSTSKTKVSSGLYSDSEDETIIKIDHQKPFGIGDIQNMTEDISEEERSYTPCLDEREPNSKEGLDGLDTEMISDDDKNDFEETQEVKTVSDGDALEINAKESELDFTRPEDCEEGEIIDKSKLKDQEDIPEEKNDTNIDNGNENENENENIDNNYKESDLDEEPVFKKLSKNNKERNYRDKERSKSREKKNRANKDSKSKDKRREKRKEIERYDVRTLVDAKPKRDRFGRDLIKRKSRSTSRSHTPPRRLGREDEFRRSKSHSSRSTPPRRFGREIRKSPSYSSSRSCTPPRRSLSRSKRSRDFRRRQRSESRSRSRDRRVSRSRIRRQHSSSRARNKSTKKDNKAKHYREKNRSRSPSKTRTNWRRRQSRAWTPSLSRSASPVRLQSPSWTPPHILNPCVRPQNLTVILPNDASKKKKDKKKRTDRKTKDNTDKQRKRRRNERSPPPSKEVFTSGNNILVSVSFNKANETTEERSKRKHDAIQELTTKRMRKEKERERTKVLKRKRFQNISNIKPVAIIDLDRSPFKELTPSPKDVIVLSDSENADSNDLLGIQKTIRRETSQQVTSPEVSVNNNYINSMGPKTPPEPQVKFTFNQKQPQLRQISNPLHEPDDVDEEIDPQEELENRLNEVMHKGPNTPPEPPNSPPSSPDAYDPFDPTKSRTPTPEPKQTNMQSSVSQVVEDTQEELVEHPVIEVLDKCDSPPGPMPVSKSHTPPIPIADIQPADSQSSIRVITPDTNIDNSPERPIGVIINQIVQSQSNLVSKPTTSAIYSSVSTSLITSTPISSNQSVSRVNILNSAIITPPIITSTISQRILPNTNNARSSPINKISPPKTSVKSTSIKPMPSKGTTKLPSTTKWKGKARNNNENDANIDFDSPYSPGSSDYEDLFEPPPETVKASAPKPTKSGKSSPKPQNTFDNLFGSSPMYINKNKNKTTKAKVKRTHHTTKGTKQVGVKLDENNLKILDELPNSAVEMQVKDKFLKKLNRQERVVEEVKFVLKPYYNKKRVTKEEYKDILRKAVPKICHNKSGEINPKKIQHLVEAYVKKMRHNKKVTSSSSVNPQKTEVVSNWLSKLN